jgi:hypothetical protein
MAAEMYSLFIAGTHDLVQQKIMPHVYDYWAVPREKTNVKRSRV